MLRVSWVQPEDLVAHELVAAADEGRDVAAIAERWADAGGSLTAAVSGATASSGSSSLRDLARELLAELDLLSLPAQLLLDEPDDIALILAAAAPSLTVVGADGSTEKSAEKLDALADRIHGAWLGRAAGCLLGKPVEKISRQGIRAILDSTGRWPLDRYFTAVGLADEVAAEYPWNRTSKPTSLEENIDGMPEDDDLNFPLISLGLLETVGRDFTTDDVARSWLANVPGGRVFTAERIVYRNLLAGAEPDIAGQTQNPFREWIGAQIRTDVYGWVNPGNSRAAARLAYRDAWLSHRRGGVYGALFVAAACAVAVTTQSIDDVLDAGLSVVPQASRYARAVRMGRELARSTVSAEEAVDEIYARLGHLHWVHASNNSALVAFALQRSGGDFEHAITAVVSGGWDTDSNGATVGSICGGLSGAAGRDGSGGLAAKWTEPLHNRLASSIPGFDGIGFDELARRTAAQVLAG